MVHKRSSINMSNLRAFNTSTKDAKSLKLRNPQLSSMESERLDTDNYKMEARLRELKQSMRRQKQERENMHSDGSIWSSGKPGAITTHGTDLLTKEPSKPSQSKGKSRKIKVLKDTPLDLPKRAPIAASFTDRSPPKFKGPACGQCEHKAVALTCMECGENYCTTCFAKFHLKGALKNHRSVPYHTNSSSSSSSSLDLSNGMMPSPKSSTESLPPRPSSANRRTTTSTDTSAQKVKTVPLKLKDPSEVTGGVFLQGTFSEEESALSFAQALAEWRAGKQNGPTETVHTHEVKKVESIASGTSTEDPQPIEITFKEDTSITYADKLLIKKHRRTELSPLPSPRLLSDEDKERRSLKQGGAPLTNGHVDPLSDDESELEEEHQRYIGIFNKSRTPDEPRLESALSIIEVTEVPSLEVVEVESVYTVEEVVDPKVPALDNLERGDGNYTLSDHDAYSPSTPSSVLHNTEPSLQTRSDQSPVISTPSPRHARVSPSPKRQQRAESTNKPTRTASTPLQTAPGSKTSESKQQHPTPQQLDASARHTSAHPTRVKPAAEKNPAKLKSKSAGVTMQRRPVAQSLDVGDVPERKTPSTEEDASGRLVGLTSTPSGELVMASHLARQPLHQYKTGLGDFFLAGLGEEEGDLNREEDENHGVTIPITRLPECSYKGALSAWRPDSSLAAHALHESLKPFSPSPPPKSGRQSHRSAAKTRQVKPPTTQEPPSVKIQGPSAKVKKGRSKMKPHPDAENTISWMLSKQGENQGKRWNDNNNGSKVDDKPTCSTGQAESKENSEPDRSSSRIEVDGDDMTVYDNTGKDNTEMEDKETLEKLTWELASQSGRITADGCLTSMSLPDPDDDIYRENSFSQDVELGILADDGMGSGLSTPFDVMTGESISPEQSNEDDVNDLEIERYTAEVQALS